MSEHNIWKIRMTDSENGQMMTIYYDNMDVIFLPYVDEIKKQYENWQNDIITIDELKEYFDIFSDVASSQGPSLKEKKLRCQLERISERITTDGMHIYFDGADMSHIQIDQALEEHLANLICDRNVTEENERDLKAWCNFTENLYGNVTPYIREQFVSWMFRQKWLTLSEDGCLIGYKGCRKNSKEGYAESYHSGPGIVNGEVMNGHIPNRDGDLIEIDRSIVEDNPKVGCARGMHVGTYEYASNFGRNGILCRVKLNPRDIISVPLECDAQKIRCCRYTVLDHEELDFTKFNVRDNYTYYDDDNEEQDDYDDDEKNYDDYEEENEKEYSNEEESDIGNAAADIILKISEVDSNIEKNGSTKITNTWNPYYDDCINHCPICRYRDFCEHFGDYSS